MFHYFGFGSNISMTSLRAKGVVPVSSVPATLYGWRLRFNVEHFFANEGGVGNIEHTGDANDRVLGVLHECLDEALAPLDATEAYGYGYDRITVEVEVQADNRENRHHVAALTYIGMPDFIDNRCLPSRRYLNIIIEGAENAGLDPDYINKLRAQPIHRPKDYPPFKAPQGEYPSFDAESLAQFPLYTALYGSVFDMSDARLHHEYLKSFFGGKDMTLFHLKRLDSSDNQESINDIKENRLNCAQREYLNGFLSEYTVEYRYVGKFNYHYHYE